MFGGFAWPRYASRMCEDIWHAIRFQYCGLKFGNIQALKLGVCSKEKLEYNTLICGIIQREKDVLRAVTTGMCIYPVDV